MKSNSNLTKWSMSWVIRFTVKRITQEFPHKMNHRQLCGVHKVTYIPKCTNSKSKTKWLFNYHPKFSYSYLTSYSDIDTKCRIICDSTEQFCTIIHSTFFPHIMPLCNTNTQFKIKMENSISVDYPRASQLLSSLQWHYLQSKRTMLRPYLQLSPTSGWWEAF